MLLVDDSIVRGNTTRSDRPDDPGRRRAQGLLRLHRAAAACIPCVYGIDMQTRDEFIARKAGSDEKIAEAIGADAVVYMSVERMVTAVKGPTTRVDAFCMACMDGNYPTGDVTPEVLATIEAERSRMTRKDEAATHAVAVPEPA